MKKIIISNTELENYEYLLENYVFGKKTLYIAITDDPNFFSTFRNLTINYGSSDICVSKFSITINDKKLISYVKKFAFIINDEIPFCSICLCKDLMEHINFYDYIIIHCSDFDNSVPYPFEYEDFLKALDKKMDIAQSIAQSIAEEFKIDNIEFIYDFRFDNRQYIKSHYNSEPNPLVKQYMKQGFLYNKAEKTYIKNIFDFKRLCNILREKQEIWVRVNFKRKNEKFLSICEREYKLRVVKFKNMLKKSNKELYEGFMRCSLVGNKIRLTDCANNYYDFSYMMIKRLFDFELYL